MSTARFCRLVGLPERSYRRWQQRERQGRPVKGPWPSPSADRLESTAVDYADRYPQWGSRTIASLMRHDGIAAPNSTVYRTLKRAGRVLEVDYKAERRQHARHRTVSVCNTRTEFRGRLARQSLLAPARAVVAA